MDFIDWRITSKEAQKEDAKSKSERVRSRVYRNYVEEQIREAEARGVFANLPGAGKPLKLDENVYAGERSMGYNLLKSNGYAPAEIELLKEIRQERQRIEAKLASLRQRRKNMRARRIPPFASEKRAFNDAVEKTAIEYDSVLRDLNRKILTLNLTVPVPMHQPMLEVASLVQQFRTSCPLFKIEN